MTEYKVKLRCPNKLVCDCMQRLLNSNPDIIEEAMQAALEDTNDLILYGTKKTFMPGYHIDVEGIKKAAVTDL